ncbi:DUF3060 domain-containing protein [Mycolicibacterium pulveris]|uniref:DUF3060 domain-containing protein n=1 Tax=Mycolicibacterium pulveris TaxID=36813 RepID=UPI003CF9A3BD
MMPTVVARTLTVSLLAVPALTVGAPAAYAEHGDTHVTGLGVTQTIDCNNATLFVNGANNRITALGSCWAVTVQGSSNFVVADNIVNDVTVYGWDQTVLYKNGAPIVWDRGRELGMTNHVDRLVA